MPEARYPCPVCLGLPMQKIQFQDPELTLDSCSRCGGIWFDFGEVNQLKQLHPQLAEKHISLRDEDYRMQCHQCSAMMDRNAEVCPECHWKNILACPVCQKPMEVVRFGDIKLDCCKACKGAWFDNIELAQLWNGRLDQLSDDYKQRRGDNDISPGEEAAYIFLDVLTYSPDLAFYTAEAAVDLISHAPDLAAGAVELVANTPDLAAGAIEMLANAPDLAGGVIEGIGHLAGGIFEVIAAILGGIFDS